jgi:FG-GAP-like repeat/Abnormal spindle-like microcephaly-assoc'd, ASPM-SPD-2-Hydin/FG-GAP repeat
MRRIAFVTLLIVAGSFAPPAQAQNNTISIASTLPAGAVTVPYGADIQVSGGTPPYTFALAAGSTLPTGFTLSPSSVGNAAAGHVLNNAPQTAGTFTFGGVVTDSTTPTPLTANATISLTIAAMPPNAQPGLLNGQYAMLLRGFNEVTGSEEAIVGSLKFDGTGIITGVLDVNSTGTIGIANLAATGTYVIGPDNRGVMSVTPAGQTLGIFAFSVGNVLNGVASTAYLTFIGTGDLYAGTLQQQDPTSFNNAAFAGTYIYDNTGQDPRGHRAAEIGLTTLNNANAVTSGSADVSDDGLTGSISAITGTYTTPDSNGRSLLSLTLDATPSSVVVYQISANEVVHMTLDARATDALLLGTAERQLNPNSFSNTSLAGPDVISLVGSEGTQGTTANIGLLTVTPGANPTVNVTLDANDQGTVTIGQAVTGPLAITANGRGTMSPGGNSLIFYLTQPDRGFVVAADTSVEFGKIVPQVGAPFSATPFANNNLFFGQQEATQGHSSQFSGIATLGAENSLTATDDENRNGGNVFFDQALGTFTYTVSPTGHFTLTSSTQGNSSGYVISPFELVFTDTTGPVSDPAPSIRPHVVIAQSISAQAAPSTVTLAPTSLAFNPQMVGTTSAAQTVTLTNNSSAALTITGITLSGMNADDFAQTDTCPASLTAGANCAISVTFTPTGAGARSGAISIADNAAGSPQTVPLAGTGATTTAPAVTLAPASLTFASQAAGTTSAAQSVTLTNSGSAALTITGITLSGTNADDFAQTNTCPASLAAGANCTISITFTPGAAGARTAAINIADNAAGSPQTVPLTGTGTGTLGANPVPLVTQPLMPDAAAPGGAAFTLTVNGTGFVSGAIVNWNGSPRTTTLVSGSRLTAAITAADIAAAKTASISVTNPGAASSNLVFFTVRNAATSVSFAGASGSPITVGTGPFAIAVGDFNGDGIQDLAVANDGAGSVTILLGNGDGTFTAAAIPPGTFSGPDAILTADFNGDGRLDLAVLNGGNNTVTILLGNGNGTFSVPDVASPTTGSNPLSFVTGDFNGDGKVDLAVANYRSNTVTILLGNGDGSFAATGATPATGSFPAAIVAGDFNKDGKLDLAVDNQCGTGGGCTAGTVTILLGDGTGNFTPAAASPATGSGPVTMAVADFNGDGNLDLAVPSDCGANGTCTTNGAVTILLGDGTGRFTASASMAATGLRPYGIVVGDFNGDGKPDLAIANNDSNTVSILLGDGTGNFTPIASPPATGAGPVFPAVGDFNNDGSLDLAVPNSGSNTISVFLAAGAPASPTITIAPSSLTFAAQALNTSSAAQTVTVSNTGNIPVVFAGLGITGPFAIVSGAGGGTCAAETDLAVEASCTINVTFTPTTAGAAAGTLSISDSATGSPQTVALSGTGGQGGVTITVAPGGSTTASTTPGGTAFYGLTISGAPGLTGTVQLGCIPSSNLITCQVIPSTITLTGTPTQIAFGIQTFCQGASNTGTSLPSGFGGKFGWPIVILAFAGMLWTLQRNRRLALSFAMIMLMTLGSGACASLPKGPNGATPAGAYSLTLTTTLNGQTQTLQNFLTLVVK